MDITEIMGQLENLWQDMKTLEQQNQGLQCLNNTIPVGYHRCADTPDCVFIFVSNRFAQMLGYTRQEIRDLSEDKFKNMVHPEVWARLLGSEACMAAIREGDNLVFTYNYNRKEQAIYCDEEIAGTFRVDMVQPGVPLRYCGAWQYCVQGHRGSLFYCP